MDASYPFREIEARWQRVWNERAASPEPEGPRSEVYIHSWPEPPRRGAAADLFFARRSAIADAVARFRRHQGAVPLLPLAIDGFEAEALEAALDRGEPPAAAALEEAGRLAALARSLGVHHDAPPVSTSEPAYYRFTQWIFLQLYARRLVFRSETESEACSRCRRRYRPGAHAACPRCGGELRSRRFGEWRLDLRPYGDRLVSDLERSDCPEGIRSIQRAVIGRCRGSEVVFPVSRPFELEYRDLTVFTTRVEMIFGVTFLLLDPDHPVLEHVLDPAYEEDVARYRERLGKGVEPEISAARTGGFALNPANLKRIPILVSPLARQPYSEGAILAVPAHDADLFVLAKRMKLAIREVIHNDRAKFDSHTKLEEPWLGDGVLTNSGSFTSLASRVGRDRIISFLGRRGVCRKATRYLLRSIALSTDASRGPPVPLVHCKRCGVVPAPDADLPIESPAAGPAALPGAGGRPRPAQEASRAPCPRCGGAAVRDAETLLPWLGTAWSFARLVLPGLAGSVPGFRDLGASPPASPPEEPGGRTGASPPEVPPHLPEDIDIFEVGPDRRADAAGIEELPGEPDGDVSAPGDSIPEEEPGAASASEAGAAPQETAAPAPAQGGPRKERRGRGRRGEDGSAGGRGQGRRPADEPETIVLKDVEDEDEEMEDLGPKPSPLEPFRGIEAAGLLPAALALGPAALRPIDLLGTRFIAKFLKDLGHLPVDEPFARYRPVASVVTKPAAAEMSEVVDLLERFGADALRLYLLFAAPAASRLEIEPAALRPFRRFLDRIWRQMMLRLEKGKFVSRRMLEEKHLLIHLVTRRLAEGKVHTAIAAIMRFVRFLEKPETAPEDMDGVAMRTFAILLSPFAPHLASELWSRTGAEEDLAAAAWPVASDELIHPPEREFLVLVDGRVRDRMLQPSNLEPEKLESRALQRDRIREIVGSRKVEKVVVVPQRLVNIVLAPASE